MISLREQRRRCVTTLLMCVAAGFAIGCGGCSKPPERTTGPAGQEDRNGDGGATAAAEEQALAPILSEEALAARVRAQRSLLGADQPLFEDRRGERVPWISASAGGFAERDTPSSIDDALLDALPGSSGIGGPQEGGGADGNSLGLFVPVEGPDDGARPLEAFHDALERLRSAQGSDAKARVLVYGASHTGADVYTDFLRTYLQDRFGDGGHGFIHVAKLNAWYRHVDMGVKSSAGWRIEHAQKREGRKDGLFGLIGASVSSSSKRDYGRVYHRRDTVASSYEIYYLEQPAGGRFDVVVDGKKAATVNTRAKQAGAGYHAIDLAEGSHEIEVRPAGRGEVRLFGLIAERARSGVVVDTLGIAGTRAANMLAWDEALWSEHVRKRDPDLIMMAYGTNEATDTEQSIAAYEANLRAVVERFQRAAPEASCLLVGPGDFPRRTEDGGVAPRPRMTAIITTQRQVASDMGCGFWDAVAFMGGELSMARWVSASPPMGRKDHIHLTRRGYVRMGMALTDAIMLDYDGDLLSRGPDVVPGG